MCPQFFYPKFETSGHRTFYGIQRAAGNGRPHAPSQNAKASGAQATPRPTPSIELRGRRVDRTHRATPVGWPRSRAPPVLPGVADAGTKPHAAARVGKRGEMALHEGASLARAGSDADRSAVRRVVGGEVLSGAWEQVPRAGGGRDAGGPPSATRVTMLLVDVEERGPSPTSRRRRAACPPTPAAAPA